MKTTSTPFKPIGDHVESIDTWSPTSACADSDFQYIDIASVDRESKRIISTTAISPVTAPSRARQLVHVGDVLVSTVRPNLNAVAMVPEKLSEAIASTGFCVLRCNPKTLDRRYLFHWVRTTAFVADMVRKATGASYPAVSDRIIKESSIPLPPLPEQKRIADILDKADAIRRKRHEAIDEFGKLSASVFAEMFTERLADANWTQLDEYLEELRYGTSNKSGETGYTTLRIPNIVRGVIDLSELKTVEVSDQEVDKLRLVDGDLLFVRTNGNPDYVGGCAIFESSQMQAAGLKSDEIIYASYLIRARLQQQRLRPLFLQSLLQTPAGRQNVREKCRTSAGQYNINTKGIGSLQIPYVDISEQIEFENRVASLRPALLTQATAESESVELFNSLVRHAFKGKL